MNGFQDMLEVFKHQRSKFTANHWASCFQWWLVESVFRMYNYQPYNIKLVQYPSKAFCLNAFWSNHLPRGWVIWNSDESKMYMNQNVEQSWWFDRYEGFFISCLQSNAYSGGNNYIDVLPIILFCLNKNNGSIDLEKLCFACHFYEMAAWKQFFGGHIELFYKLWPRDNF